MSFTIFFRNTGSVPHKWGDGGRLPYGKRTNIHATTLTTIYLLQPVLPVLQQEFGVDEKRASLVIAAVIFGMALSNLPFGRLADRWPIKPIIAAGGLVVV